MAANLRRVFANSNFPTQFPKYFLYKYIEINCRRARGRLFSMLAMRRDITLAQNTRFNSSNFVVGSRFVHVGSIKESTGRNDPEFVTEEFSLSRKNKNDIRDMMEHIKTKTGVIMKAIDGKVNEKGLKIIVGGTRHEVQQAIFYLKSSVDQDSSNQRLVLLQDEKVEQQYSSKKEKPIWAYYRRNFKGQKPPMKTRKKCIRGKGESQIVSGNPCPVCRLYLAGGYKLDYKDVDLLIQFISPHSGEIFEPSKTGVCRYQQQNLETAIQSAKDYGLLPYSIPGPRSIAKPAKQAQIPVNVKLK